MKYTEKEVDVIFVENLKIAIQALSGIPIAKGRSPSFQGLNGWVYEQTIRACLEDELTLRGLNLPIREQFQIKGRAKADLLVGRTAIEIKAGGLFGDDSEKYKRYKSITVERNLSYLYITRQETHMPYYHATKQVFDDEFSFFLSEKCSWERFVMAVVSTNTTD